MADGDGERSLEHADEASRRLDADGLIAHLSAAIRAFTDAGDRRRAAMTCARLGNAYAWLLGNQTAARAWLARARRLVAAEPPCVEQGWIAVAANGCDVDDPAELFTSAQYALDIARRFGDINLEAKALADSGLARVQAGDVDAGMAMLDEAMALVCGPADDLDTVGLSVCSFFTACYYAADFGRAGSWRDPLRRRGAISREPGAPAFLSSHCDSVHAALLVELGQWGEAERVLLQAKSDFEAAMPVQSWHPDIVLADLRVRQTRLAEAEALLLGKDLAVEALIPAARLHLARGDVDLARATARRGLGLVGDSPLRAVDLLSVIVDADVARFDIDGATKAAGELAVQSRRIDVPALRARANAARARALMAAGELTDAVAALERAVDEADPTALPWLRATLQLDLAELRDRLGDSTTARVEAKAAATTLAALDVALSPRHTALLDRLCGSTSRHGATIATMRRDGRQWALSYDGTSVLTADTKGLRYLAELFATPGVERHALDLVDRVEGVPAAAAPDRRTLGSAGELLDGRTRTAYRHRIAALRLDIDEALAAGLLETAERLQAEHDQLVAELARAFGLGGRNRQAASAAERARLNVTRALRAAIARLAETLPDAAAVLDRRVRTGLYCVYEPVDDDPVRWIVQS